MFYEIWRKCMQFALFEVNYDVFNRLLLNAILILVFELGFARLKVSYCGGKKIVLFGGRAMLSQMPSNSILMKHKLTKIIVKQLIMSCLSVTGDHIAFKS